MMAIDPALVHRERYSPDLATANPPPGTWSAYPSPSTIGLYKEGQGYPTFDPVKAKTAYNDFLTLWKDADPDSVLLKRAMAEFAKLQ